MTSVLQDLEILLEESLKVLATPDADMTQLQSWRARREAIFARLQGADFQLPGEERAKGARLIKEILAVDATILARLKASLAILGQKIDGAGKMRRALGGNVHSYSPSLMERVA